MFATSREAVAGSAVPVAIGDSFTPAHGHGDAADEDAHSDVLTVVGRMPPTGSPWDKAIIVPVESVWEVHGLPNGHPFEEGSEETGTTTPGPPLRPRTVPPARPRLSSAQTAWARPIRYNRPTPATRKAWPSFPAAFWQIFTA